MDSFTAVFCHIQQFFKMLFPPICHLLLICHLSSMLVIYSSPHLLRRFSHIIICFQNCFLFSIKISDTCCPHLSSQSLSHSFYFTPESIHKPYIFSPVVCCFTLQQMVIKFILLSFSLYQKRRNILGSAWARGSTYPHGGSANEKVFKCSTQRKCFGVICSMKS